MNRKLFALGLVLALPLMTWQSHARAADDASADDASSGGDDASSKGDDASGSGGDDAGDTGDAASDDGGDKGGDAASDDGGDKGGDAASDDGGGDGSAGAADNSSGGGGGCSTSPTRDSTFAGFGILAGVLGIGLLRSRRRR
jgi:hypothetical protein